MKNRRQSAAKVPYFSKKRPRKQWPFGQNWNEMSPALLKIAKRRRRAKDKEMIECRTEDSSVDRLSMLPDEVLALILSHFTFKELMAFSTLSRRWRYLWTLTTRFDFVGITMDTLERLRQEKGTSVEKEKLNYVSWVNRVLASCQSPTIEDFRVCFNLSEKDGGYINEWLRYALAKKVKKLVLNFTDYLARREIDECYVFPYRSLHIEKEIHFKQLEKLSLDYVCVDDEALKFLLHNCPLLEDLSISNSSKLSSLRVAGPFPSLKRLVVRSCCNLDLLYIRDVNLVHLGYDGPNIEFRLHNVPKLVNLSVPMREFKQLNPAFVHFLSILQQLEALYLHNVCRFSFSVKMSNLKQLEITHLLDSCNYLQWLADIIRSVPSLQKFVFKAVHSYSVFPEWELERKKIKKSYHQLKEVEFVGFLGVPSEVNLVWFFVDNAVGLKRVVIDPTVRVTCDGHTSRKDLYSEKEIIALDRAERRLALQMPSKIRLEFRRPPHYPSPVRRIFQGFGLSRALGV